MEKSVAFDSSKEWGMGVLRKLANIGVCAGLSCVLAACDGNEHPAAEAAGAGAVSPQIMLSSAGVGPLNAGTPFNLVTIGDAFQEYNVQQETHFTEDDKYPVITIKEQVKPLLSINPDNSQKGIFSIIVHDNLIGNELGHRIGTRFADIYTPENTEQCAPALEEWVGKVMCYAPKTPNILYLFTGEWNGPSDQLPPMETLANWTLEAMVWKSPKK